MFRQTWVHFPSAIMGAELSFVPMRLLVWVNQNMTAMDNRDMTMPDKVVVGVLPAMTLNTTPPMSKAVNR